MIIITRLTSKNEGFISITGLIILSFISNVFYWYYMRLYMIIEIKMNLITYYEGKIITFIGDI